MTCKLLAFCHFPKRDFRGPAELNGRNSAPMPLAPSFSSTAVQPRRSKSPNRDKPEPRPIATPCVRFGG